MIKTMEVAAEKAVKEPRTKLYLFEKCNDCGRVYAHYVKGEAEQATIKHYQAGTLKNDKGHKMRGLDCVNCKSKNTKYVQLSRLVRYD